MIVKDAQKNMLGLGQGGAGGGTDVGEGGGLSSSAPPTPSGGKGCDTKVPSEDAEKSSKNGYDVDNDASVRTGGDRIYIQSQTHKSSMVPAATKSKVVNAEALTNLSAKFCSSSELSYLQSIMSSGNLKGRSTTEFYTIGKVVGVGSFAKVRLAWHKLTGQAIAIKTYEKSKMKDASHLRRVQQEIKVMEKLNHPRLIRLFETLESPKRIHLIMEFVSAGNLCSYVKRRRRLPEEEARKIFYQISVALCFMHDSEIIHRDVKLENVLLDKDGNSKLIDFGFSVFSKDKKALKVFCGTPSYMAPEIVRRIEYEGKPIDAWSLGVVLYALVCGCFPFSAKSYPELYKKIMRGQFRIPDTLSQGVKDLIRNLLVLDPRKRYTVHQARSHPWVHSGKGGAFSSTSGWTCDPGCSEILINKNPALDLNEGVIKTMDSFGIKREATMHNVLNKSHNGISTCYYLLKQAMKDNGTLVEEDGGENGEAGKETVSKAALKSSKATKSVRPMSAPSHKVYKPARPQATVKRKEKVGSVEVEEDEEEDSFIKEDNGGDSVAGGL
mmetsp:Transcript_23018/g.47709  ORF Transcript_23018/g.47709 Transcript_23018/m.47709 type:complete len:553 (+) Transcript_23018:337-1995(+)